MSPSLRNKFDAIHREVVVLHFKWTYFLQLFGHQAGVKILNASAPALFKVIEDAMFYDIALSVMRLIDPPKTLGRQNLSFSALVLEIDDAQLRKQVVDIETQIAAKTRDVKSWRHRKLAHNDLTGHLAKARTLPSIQYSDLFRAIELVRRAMQLLHAHYDNTDFRYEHCITQADGKMLLFHLKYGLECWEEDRCKKDLKRWKTITEEINLSLAPLPLIP